MRRPAGALISLVVLLLPWLEGCIPGKATIAYLSFMAAAWTAALILGGSRPILRKALLALSVSCALLVVCDLILRAALSSAVFYRPHERFVQRWPPMPLVARYKPNVSFDGSTFGDLAAKIGKPEYRQRREVHFESDDRGFANPQGTKGSYDVVLLGDSFGLGIGTTMPRTWAELLRTDHGLNVYNISMPGSPWQQMLNWMIEGDRIAMKPGGVAILAVFSGNDLDEEYGSELDVERLPWTTVLQRAGERIRVFRERSIVRRLLYNVYYGSAENPHVIVRAWQDAPMLFYEPHAAVMRRTRDEILAHTNMPALRRVLDRFQAYSVEQDIRPIVLLLPSKEEVYAWLLDGGEAWTTQPASGALAGVLREACEERGMTFLDLKADYVRASRALMEDRGAWLWWSDDTHWNEAGHRLAADLVIRILQGAE
jgi:hypothetical protein